MSVDATCTVAQESQPASFLFFPTVLLDVVSVFLFVSFLLAPSYCCSLIPRYSQSFFIFKLI